MRRDVNVKVHTHSEDHHLFKMSVIFPLRNKQSLDTYEISAILGYHQCNGKPLFRILWTNGSIDHTVSLHQFSTTAFPLWYLKTFEGIAADICITMNEYENICYMDTQPLLRGCNLQDRLSRQLIPIQRLVGDHPIGTFLITHPYGWQPFLILCLSLTLSVQLSPLLLSTIYRLALFDIRQPSMIPYRHKNTSSVMLYRKCLPYLDESYSLISTAPFIEMLYRNTEWNHLTFTQLTQWIIKIYIVMRQLQYQFETIYHTADCMNHHCYGIDPSSGIDGLLSTNITPTFTRLYPLALMAPLMIRMHASTIEEWERVINASKYQVELEV